MGRFPSTILLPAVKFGRRNAVQAFVSAIIIEPGALLVEEAL